MNKIFKKMSCRIQAFSNIIVREEQRKSPVSRSESLSVRAPLSSWHLAHCTVGLADRVGWLRASCALCLRDPAGGRVAYSQLVSPEGRRFPFAVLLSSPAPTQTGVCFWPALMCCMEQLGSYLSGKLILETWLNWGNKPDRRVSFFFFFF